MIAAKKTFRVRKCAKAPCAGTPAPGDSILIAGSCGLMGAEKLAELYPDRVREHFPEKILERCLKLYSGSDGRLSPESPENFLTDRGAGLTAACVPGDGGILAALWDLSEYAGCGFEADLRRIPLRQEVTEVCELLDVNPYRLNAGGCVLFTASNGDRAAAVLGREGIPCSVIGWLDRTKAKKLHSGEILTYLDFPAPDELLAHLPAQEKTTEDLSQ